MFLKQYLLEDFFNLEECVGSLNSDSTCLPVKSKKHIRLLLYYNYNKKKYI